MPISTKTLKQQCLTLNYWVCLFTFPPIPHCILIFRFVSLMYFTLPPVLQKEMLVSVCAFYCQRKASQDSRGLPDLHSPPSFLSKTISLFPSVKKISSLSLPDHGHSQYLVFISMVKKHSSCICSHLQQIYCSARHSENQTVAITIHPNDPVKRFTFQQNILIC